MLEGRSQGKWENVLNLDINNQLSRQVFGYVLNVHFASGSHLIMHTHLAMNIFSW